MSAVWKLLRFEIIIEFEMSLFINSFLIGFIYFNEPLFLTNHKTMLSFWTQFTKYLICCTTDSFELFTIKKQTCFCTVVASLF